MCMFRYKFRKAADLQGDECPPSLNATLMCDRGVCNKNSAGVIEGSSTKVGVIKGVLNKVGVMEPFNLNDIHNSRHCCML